MKKYISLRCKVCGRETSHYLDTKTGAYHCSVCGHVNKMVKVELPKPKKTVEFVPDFEIPIKEGEKTEDITPTRIEPINIA